MVTNEISSYLLSHRAPEAVFPIFFPSEVVIKGAVNPNNCTLFHKVLRNYAMEEITTTFHVLLK
jgi:hypothetical protein